MRLIDSNRLFSTFLRCFFGYLYKLKPMIQNRFLHLFIRYYRYTQEAFEKAVAINGLIATAFLIPYVSYSSYFFNILYFSNISYFAYTTYAISLFMLPI